MKSILTIFLENIFLGFRETLQSQKLNCDKLTVYETTINMTNMKKFPKGRDVIFITAFDEEHKTVFSELRNKLANYNINISIITLESSQNLPKDFYY